MQNITSVIDEIQQGNEQLREEFISSHRERIRQYASYVCKRQLEWQNDDELSISLLAFNRGIDSFDPGHGKGFFPYARFLIKNSLIDYFKSQGKKGNPLTVPLPMDDGEHATAPFLAAASRQEFEQEINRRERAYEIALFKEVLGDFSLTLHELVEFSPRHGDTRKLLKEAACRVGAEAELVSRIYREKKLPIKEIQLLTGLKRKSLEKWRRYLLSLVIVRTYPELEELGEYLWGKEPSR